MYRTQLDDVSDDAHNEETDTDGLADLEELALVGLTVRDVSVFTHKKHFAKPERPDRDV